MASEIHRDIPVDSVVEETLSERTDLVYMEGKPGDMHLVYTYKEGNSEFKVVENSVEDFTQVNSTTYILEDDGSYSEYSTQAFSIGSNGEAIIKSKKEDEKTEVYVISNADRSERSSLVPMIAEYEWITEYSNGSTHFANFTISVIIAEIGYIATLAGGPIVGAVATGVTTVAQVIFNLNAKYVYYHKIYNWKPSERNCFLIEETEWTGYYTDSAHKNYIGYTYEEWRDESY